MEDNKKAVPLDIMEKIENVLAPIGFCIGGFRFDNHGIDVRLIEPSKLPFQKFIGEDCLKVTT